MAQRDELIRVLTQTRDQAFATLQRHGLAIPTQLPNKEEQLEDSSRDVGKPRDFPPEEKIKELEAQNSNLRSVIKQMRQDMENLGNEFAARPSSTMGQRRDSEKGSPVPLTKGNGRTQVTKLRLVVFLCLIVQEGGVNFLDISQSEEN